MIFLKTDKKNIARNYAKINREKNQKINQLGKSKPGYIETLEELLSQKMIITNQ